jgi:hypothetical protein
MGGIAACYGLANACRLLLHLTAPPSCSWIDGIDGLMADGRKIQ